jgi:hypothetical protein
MTVESIAPTVPIAHAHVRATERLSPAFVRLTLDFPALTDLGIKGFDTRFKIVLAGPTGELPPLSSSPEARYARGTNGSTSRGQPRRLVGGLCSPQGVVERLRLPDPAEDACPRLRIADPDLG